MTCRFALHFKRSILFVSFFSLVSTFSYAITPTPEQIQQFRSLPASQQEALAKQQGIELSALQSASPATTVDLPVTVGTRDVTDQAVSTSLSSGVTSKTGIKSDEDATGSPVRILKPFGYSLFAGTPSTFAPATDIPVPVDYVLGPGDVINVQLFGKSYKNLTIAIDRNGTFILPEIGPINVTGLSFNAFRKLVNKQLEEKVIGSTAVITMGELRSIRVFILGEAFKPGAYTLSSLSTITHALFLSGGVTEVGSLRNIQLKRKGKSY